MLSPLASLTRVLSITISLLGFCICRAMSSPIVVSGNLVTDDDIHSTFFSVEQTGTVTFYTTSYAGGTNADGTITLGGGFDPILSLFDSNGNTIDYNDEDFTGFVNTDPNTGLATDSYFTAVLNPGAYQIAVSQYDNLAPLNNMNWSEAGNPNFTSQFFNPFNPLPGPFLDQTGDQRTSAYTYNIDGNNLGAAVVPEASAGAYLGLAIVITIAGATSSRIKRTGNIALQSVQERFRTVG